MKILVINAGSSTLKFQFMDTVTTEVYAKGNVEKIGEEGSFLRYKAHGQEKIIDSNIANHKQAIQIVLDTLTDKKVGVVKNVKEIEAFGHRVVNVGESYFDPCLVTKEVLEDFKTKVDFSPLHVPGAIAGLEGCMAVCPNTPHVAVFDIGFHKTIPAHIYKYAIPNRYYDEFKIRRYGAHGTSHYYVTERCAALLGKKPEDINIISCHIGSGASITAVKNGKSYDTSMGFTPLEGIIMNTRSGDIDPAVIEFICNKDHKTVSEVLTMLNKKSGLYGLTDGMADMRDITENLDKPMVKQAFDMYCHRIKKYICAYIGILGGVDAIVFTAGCGEHTPELREAVTKNLEFMGIAIDNKLNYNLPRGQEVDISKRGSKVKTFVIPTNEELVIAKETEKLVKNM